MKENIALIKSKKFALRIINLYKYLNQSKQEYIMAKQILRSGTSIGANLAEAECAISRNDFLSKVYIALKECSETQYWLSLLKESGYISSKEHKSLYTDCNEITKMLTTTTKTIKTRDYKIEL